MLAVLERQIAVDEGRVVAGRTLNVTRRAAGEVADQLRLALTHGGEVEDVDVGAHSRRQHAAIFQTDHPRRA